MLKMILKVAITNYNVTAYNRALNLIFIQELDKFFKLNLNNFFYAANLLSMRQTKNLMYFFK